MIFPFRLLPVTWSSLAMTDWGNSQSLMGLHRDWDWKSINSFPSVASCCEWMGTNLSPFFPFTGPETLHLPLLLITRCQTGSDAIPTLPRKYSFYCKFSSELKDGYHFWRPSVAKHWGWLHVDSAIFSDKREQLLKMMFLINEQNMSVMYIDINAISLYLDFNIFQ